MEAELKAARERAVVPQEARMSQFKDMLLERGVRHIHFIYLTIIQKHTHLNYLQKSVVCNEHFFSKDALN